ncbi:MAG TPA: serine/threonine-protein kinase [Planctomycetota bacterium]|nr:serine/threonine-protein kinase [Planctomycetota bacterium]
MAEQIDDQLAKLAMAQGLVSEAEMRAAREELARRGHSDTPGALGALLVERGSLTTSQLERLSASAQAAALKTPKVGDYRLVEKLGAGGMGAVYKAQRGLDGQIVALKILPRSKAQDAEFLDRFEAEARAAFELSHPNIVRALDMGQADGYHYIAMEFVDGRDLYQILEKRGKLDAGEAVGITIQIAEALEHAHGERLVHRDIKPDNILIENGTGKAKLTDLGLCIEEPSVLAKPRITRRGLAMGTPFYFSPEQARGEEDIDIRSDIYALGATLYEMVTGKPPFEGASAAQVMLRHIQEEVISPKEIDRSIPDGLCRVIERMMAKSREDRYQTPTELLVDLRLVADGKPPRSAELKAGLSSVRSVGGGPKGPSKLAPMNFSDVPVVPAKRATRSRVQPVTRSGTRPGTRGPRTTLTEEVPRKLPAWAIIAGLVVLVSACLAGGYLLSKAFSGRDKGRTDSAPTAPPAPTPAGAPKTPGPGPVPTPK